SSRADAAGEPAPRSLPDTARSRWRRARLVGDRTARGEGRGSRGPAGWIGNRAGAREWVSSTISFASSLRDATSQRAGGGDSSHLFLPPSCSQRREVRRRRAGSTHLRRSSLFRRHQVGPVERASAAERRDGVLYGGLDQPGPYLVLMKWYPGYMSAPHSYA